MSKPIVLKRGLDIPVKGAADLVISKTIVPDVVAVCPSDYRGLNPRLLVKEGDAVRAGSPVLADKKNPEILVTSPVSGTVAEVVRGEKRRLLAVRIALDAAQQYEDFSHSGALDADGVRDLLLRSGLWTALVQRPYGIVADPAVKPKAIFVSAFDTAPLAPDFEFTLGGEMNAIQAAVDALALLTDGKVHVSVNSSESAFCKLKGVVLHSFEGPHPAGNVGVQISHISPIRKGETVWTVSPAALACIGRLLMKGRVDLRRKVAVTGSMAIETCYVQTLPGMPMSCLRPFVGTNEDSVRIVSGNILSGKNAGIEGYLGAWDTQVTVLKEGTEPELLGWIRPLRFRQFSADRSYFSWLTPWRRYDLDTNLHGGPRAFVMSDAYYRRVLPMDIYPLYLVKACLAGDIDKMESHGIYEVLPEDLALCEFVDPSKNPIQSIVSDAIDLMMKEMA